MNDMRLRSRRGPVRQRGNALILALLALAIAGLGAITALQNRRVELKRDIGIAEATVLERLRNGAQSAVYEHLTAIQQGLPIEKNGVSIEPASVGGELVWSPTIDHLRSMNYLPDGWTNIRSSLNDGAYGISFRRMPAGCAAPSCDVEGLVAIHAPILDGGPGAPVDGVVIGPILTRSGADGGVSLATSPATIRGFNNTWSLPNPVSGNPAGVVAMRFGTNTGGFSQFVRVGDLRDPQLGGNLSAAGNLAIAGGSTVSGNATFAADASVQGAVRVGPATDPCVTLNPNGLLSVTCAGVLNTRTGVFEDTGGNRSEIGPKGVTTTGRLQSDDGFESNGNVLFGSSDPNAISVAAGDLFIRGPAGNLVSIEGGNLRAEGVVTGRRLAIAEAITEGANCESASTEAVGVQFGVTADRSLAVCANARWIVSFRMGSAGGQCNTSGSTATDIADGQSLICRDNMYLRTSSLLSKFVLMNTLALQMTNGPVRVQKPVCPASGSSVPAERLIILSPNNEDAAFSGSNILSGINRFALDVGDAWDVVLERSSDATALNGNLIATLYCYYG